jgi:transposase
VFSAVVRDARSLPSEAQAELRRTAVRLVGEGRSKTEVAGLLGVARETVGRWIKAHARGGDRALDARRRGRRPGHTKLTDAQQLRIAGLVAGKNPDQLKLPGFLWTRALVAELIVRELGVEVGEETVGRYLRAWGFSPQKPMRRAYEQSDEAVRRWLEQTYPARRDPLGRRVRPAVRPHGRAQLGADRPDPGHQGHRQALQGQPDRRDLQRRHAPLPRLR